jgi:hypothetical protein
MDANKWLLSLLGIDTLDFLFSNLLKQNEKGKQK